MTDIPDEIMQRAYSLLSDMRNAVGYFQNAEVAARALMEAEARGYARAKEQAAKEAKRLMNEECDCGGAECDCGDIRSAGYAGRTYAANVIRHKILTMEMSDEQT